MVPKLTRRDDISRNTEPSALMEKNSIKVLIIQPVVPAYRLSFFRELILRGFLDITILAGKRVFWGPESCEGAEEIANLGHETRAFLGDQLFWQENLWIPKHYGAGDILVLTGAPRLLNNPFLIVQARWKKMKIVWWGQGWTAGLRPWMLTFRRVLMKMVDVVVLYTEKEAREYAIAGFEQKPVFGLNNTIGTTEISLQRQWWNTARLDEFKKSQGFTRPFRLLFVSRIKQKTRLDLAIEALRYLPEELYELVIIGDGPELDAWQTVAREHGVDDRVRWLGAIYKEEALAPYFLTASCFVYPGAIGLSLLHAFAYGLPVITHRDALLHGPEFAALTDGVNGLTFQPGNPHNLAEKIEKLCRDMSLLQSMRDNALRRIENEFSMEHMVETFEKAVRCAASI